MKSRGLPCHNCISLPICKSLYYQYRVEGLYFLSRMNASGALKEKCVTLRRYLERHDSQKERIKKKTKFHNYFLFSIPRSKNDNNK